MSELRAAIVQRVLYWISLPRQRGRRRLVIAVICFGVVLLIGSLDSATGADLTLNVLYLVPVAGATLACGGVVGVFMVAASTVVGTLADFFRLADQSTAIILTNAALRTLMLLIALALITGLRGALERAQRLEQRSRDFLGIAAHQLRTPIASVRMAVDSLIIQGVPPKQEVVLNRIAKETARGGRLVDSLLRIARLDQGELAPVGECNIREIVHEEVNRVQAWAPSLEVKCFVEPGVPLTVRMSPDATQEALENLLDNALKHASEFVGVAVSVVDEQLQIRVYDDGDGIAPADAERVFDRFVTLDGRGGSGLGLPIARGLIRRQDGDLVYSDRAFVMTLPIPE